MNGFCGYGTTKKEAKSKAPPSKTEGRARRFLSGFIVRATGSQTYASGFWRGKLQDVGVLSR